MKSRVLGPNVGRFLVEERLEEGCGHGPGKT